MPLSPSPPDIDECEGVVCGGASTCTNAHDRFSCECAAGWTWQGDNQVCKRSSELPGTDGDECEGVVCGGKSVCVDGDRKYRCECAEGWRGGGDNAVCEGEWAFARALVKAHVPLIPPCPETNACNFTDVDCGGTSACQPDGEGGYRCECADGWEDRGSGQVCAGGIACPARH